MNKIKIHKDLQRVGEIFEEHDFKSYLVGGAVRDIFLGKESHDWDLTTNATPQQVMKIFKKVIPTGIEHGTVTIHVLGHQIETTTFRTEGKYSDGRHPDKIEFAATLEEDLSRRDFTMNAIAADLKTGILQDPFNGIKDIQDKIIRTVGNPFERFSEDGLRPVRAVRFAGQLEFKIEEETLKAISNPEILQKTKGISVERFHDEFCKMMTSKQPSISLKLMEKTGILDLFIPEFSDARKCDQKDSRGYHIFDVADHLFYACDGAKPVLEIRLAALFHDIGKPYSNQVEYIDGEKIIHFHGHENKGAQITDEIFKRLKFSNEIKDKVVHLIREHMFNYEPAWKDAAVRRFLVRVGINNVADLIDLRLADCYGKYNCPLDAKSPAWLELVELQNRIQKIQEENGALSIKDLKINGKDLIQLGYKPGKLLGEVLNELFETVLDSPSMNSREKLLEIAKNKLELMLNI